MLAHLLMSCALVALASAHGYIGVIQGKNGQVGIGFGVTDKPGSRPSFDRKLTSRLSSLSSPIGCGSTIASGAIDIARSTNESIAVGVPSFATGQAFGITYVQINGGADGGGPLRAFVDKTGTGQSFVALPMAKNIDVEGRANTAHRVAIQISKTLDCAGRGGTCLFLVQQPRRFGSCFVAKPTRASRCRSRARKAASLRMIRRTRRFARVARPRLSVPVVEP